MSTKRAIIIGAGPAGITAALEFLKSSDIKPVIYEMTSDIGGISKTVNHNGNRIDIGGHRFFSKSDVVMKWWTDIFPIGDPSRYDDIMLVRSRVSRIFYLRKFFDYPVSLSMGTIKNLGLVRLVKIGISYVRASIFPIKNEKSLEDFFINRFGRELYETFFKDYTQKVWGVPCSEIKPEWGAQRVKGLSVTKALIHAVKSIFKKKRSISQKDVETSLIEQFMYPKLGPGQLWEKAADMVKAQGGEIHINHKVTTVKVSGGQVTSVTVRNELTGKDEEVTGDYFLSTMPVRELIEDIGDAVPDDVKKVSSGLKYRDFMTVGLLVNDLKVKSGDKNIPDNWIYVQERDVKLGRIQVFNNWSPYLVKDRSMTWLGLEYFCNEGDEMWTLPDKDMIKLAVSELVKIGFADEKDVEDAVVIRMPKTYPAYFGTYDDFDVIRKYVDKIENLFLMGRNGMHRYNNMDHSMLTAITAVNNIRSGVTSKANIWEVNTEKEYHEEKK